MQQFRGLPVYDGGFAASQPCPPGVKKCVRISTSNPTWPKRSSVETFMARLAFKGPQAIMRPDPTVRTWPAIVPSGPDAEVLKLAASKGVDIAPGEGQLLAAAAMMAATAAAVVPLRWQRRQHSGGSSGSTLVWQE